MPVEFSTARPDDPTLGLEPNQYGAYEFTFNGQKYWVFPRGTDLNAIFGPIKPATVLSVSDVAAQMTALLPGDPIQYHFGRGLVTPKLINAIDYGDDKIAIDMLVSTGICQEIEYLTLAGEDIGLPDETETYLGTSGQAASTLMTSLHGSYDALAGICHVVVVVDATSGGLDYKVMAKGLKLYDPRSPSPNRVYSTNPALALYRVFSDLNYTVDDTSFGNLADYCDETVGTENRWTIGLTTYTRDHVFKWAHALAQYCGGAGIDIQGDTVYAVVPKPRNPNHTILDDDEVGLSMAVRKLGKKHSVKKVIVHYNDEGQVERVAETTGTASAGEVARLVLPGFTSYTMARRFAQQIYNRAQSDLEVTVTKFDSGLSHTIGDVAEITNTPRGLTAKKAELIEYNPTGAGRWTAKYREYAAAHYLDTVYTEPAWNDTTLTNPNAPPDGPTPTLAEELYTDGTTYTRFKITFTGVSWLYASSYQVTCTGEQNVLNVVIPHEGATTHTVYTAPLKSGVSYTCNVKVISRTGVLSTNPGTAAMISAGSALPPGDVPSIAGFEAGTLVALSWEPAEEIPGDLAGYTIKRIPEADYVGTSADWTHTNTVTLTERLDATSYLTPSQPSGTYYYGIKAEDIHGTESNNATWKKIVVTAQTGATNSSTVNEGVLVNMHAYTIDGDARYVITSTGETWGARFGNTSPLATWGDAVTQSPAERWGGDLATDSSFESAVYDSGATRQGNWTWGDDNVTIFGGTQLNQILIGDESSPISYTTTTGTAVSQSGRYLKAKVSTTDSPASAGDGIHIRLPVDVSFAGQVLEQSGTVTIAAASPLDNPKAVTFATPYSDVPVITVTPKGGALKIATYDNETVTGFDLYLFASSGLLTDGEASWTSKGT